MLVSASTVVKSESAELGLDPDLEPVWGLDPDDERGQTQERLEAGRLAETGLL